MVTKKLEAITLYFSLYCKLNCCIERNFIKKSGTERKWEKGKEITPFSTLCVKLRLGPMV